MYCRCNPDSDIRLLERIFQQEPTTENRNRLNDARIRAGLPLILEIRKGWEEWAGDHPPNIALSKPESPYEEVDNYIEAEKISDHIELVDEITCMVLFYHHIFYVVAKHDPGLSWSCSKCKARMSYEFGRWLCKECGWRS
jgi:hypothetical protein